MDLATARAGAPASVRFHDGLGERYQVPDAATSQTLEVLCLRAELTSVPAFEFSLRERVARLAGFRHAYYGHVRSVERLDGPPSALAIVSEQTPGVRLSEILDLVKDRRITLDISAALCLIRQLVPAVAALHEYARDVAHGAIAPERIVVTPNARLVIVEHVFGSALEQLRYSNERYWNELRLALPRSPGLARIDQRADVTEVGVVALSLILGRPLADEEFPGRVGEVLASAWATSHQGDLAPLPAALRSWLSRALQLDPRQSFASTVDARGEFEKTLANSGYGAAPADLERVLAQYHACVEAISSPLPPARVATPAPIAKVQPPVVGKVEPATPAIEVAAPVKHEPPITVRSEPRTMVVKVDAPPADHAESPAATITIDPPPMPGLAPPVASKVEPARPKLEKPPVPKVEPTVRLKPDTTDPGIDATARLKAHTTDSVVSGFGRTSPKAEAPEIHMKPAPSPRWRSGRLVAAAVVLIGLASGGALAARRYLLPARPGSRTGTLAVATDTPGAEVVIDGQPRGTTPLTLTLNPGSHMLEVRGSGAPRTMPVTVTAGAQLSQYIELPKTRPVSGELQIHTTPSGAKVTVDGQARGVSPLTVEDLAPGTHTVVLENDIASVSQDVKVEAGVTASLVVPLTAAQGAPVSGWISIAAPVDMQLFEGGRLLGSSKSDRIMVSAGKHEIDVVNEQLGYRATRTVQVPPGKVSTVKVDLPTGTIALNAIPWADVWVDGEKIGETPIGNLSLAIGSHEVVFRHPELGEQRHVATVTLNAPTRLSVDLRKK